MIQKAISNLPRNLLQTLQLLSQAGRPETIVPAARAESREYDAYFFSSGKQMVEYRSAKITPTKTGQFVTLWKRSEKGPIQPFDSTDSIDLFIIAVRKEDYFGVFLFPRVVLVEKRILTGIKEGKRAMRVYPPWDNAANKQAQKTQQWQLEYFLEVAPDGPADLERAKKLLNP